MTPTKEDVLKKHFDKLIKENPDDNWQDWDCKENDKPKAAIYAAMIEYASLNRQGCRWTLEDLVVYDQINGDFIEVASLEDALKYIKEVATDPEEGIHPDIESIKIYKEVADVVCEEVEGEEETYRVKVIPRESTPIPIQTPCVGLEKEVERLNGLIAKWENEAKEAWRKIQIYKDESDRYKKA